MTRLESPTQLASLVGYLSGLILRDVSRTDAAGPACCQTYLQACRAVAQGTLAAGEGARAVERSLLDMRTIVPERWAAFVFPELQQVAQEVVNRAGQRSAGSRDDVSLERLNDVFALKTVRLIALGAGGVPAGCSETGYYTGDLRFAPSYRI
jgi:hypothetical protein